MASRVCNTCSINKPINEFYGFVTKKGTQCYSWKCKKCRNIQIVTHNSGAGRLKHLARVNKYWRTEKGQAKNKELGQRRRHTVHGKIAHRCRERLRTVLKMMGGTKTKSTADLVGCSWEELKNWISNRFSAGMSFDNIGEWVIDHKIPLAAFDLSDDIQLARAMHFTNLQPLWKCDNAKKSDLLPDGTRGRDVRGSLNF